MVLDHDEPHFSKKTAKPPQSLKCLNPHVHRRDLTLKNTSGFSPKSEKIYWTTVKASHSDIEIDTISSFQSTLITFQPNMDQSTSNILISNMPISMQMPPASSVSVHRMSMLMPMLMFNGHVNVNSISFHVNVSVRLTKSPRSCPCFMIMKMDMDSGQDTEKSMR